MSIVYNGINFSDHGEGYYKNKRHGKLHRYIYKMYNGNIPRGMHVHHKDEDKDNNEPYNLILLTSSEHQSLHCKGKPKSDEHKRKISETKKGKPYLGKTRTIPHTPEMVANTHILSSREWATKYNVSRTVWKRLKLL